MALDLTPFGFTPTESSAYEALLALGPSSGYAVAKEIQVARANAYQALNGLVAKSAAQLIDENPLRFRAVRPEALLTRIAADEADKLAQLERQVREYGSSGGDAIVPLEGERGVLEVLTRAAGLAEGEVRCVAPRRILDALQPVWRKRDVDGQPTVLLATEDGTLTDFPHPPILLATPGVAVIAADGDPVRGHWVSDPTWVALAGRALAVLTATA